MKAVADQTVIYRDEVVAMLFTINDIKTVRLPELTEELVQLGHRPVPR